MKKWADKITAIQSKNVELDKYQITVRLSFLPKMQQKLDFHPRSRVNGREEVKVTMMQIKNLSKTNKNAPHPDEIFRAYKRHTSL